jgi:hypothetical protein
MKQNYSENCRKNLFENSVEKNDYDAALKEWFFFDEVIDNNDYAEMSDSRPACELCRHEDLRWQFTIININNDNRLKVGSSCIKQFNIALVDKNGNKIDGRERNAAINKLITLRRIASANTMTFQAMDDLCKADRNVEQNALFMESWMQLKVNGTLEPKLALFLINQFIEKNIDYSNIDMKIDTQKRKYTEQINKMPKTAYMLIRPYLSAKKKEYYDSYHEHQNPRAPA